MGILKGLLVFGAGMMAAKYAFPKVSESIEKIKNDTKEILHDENLIKQMCVDQIAQWYYDGSLDATIQSIVKQRAQLSDETKAKLHDLRHSVPIWPN